MNSFTRSPDFLFYIDADVVIVNNITERHRGRSLHALVLHYGTARGPFPTYDGSILKLSIVYKTTTLFETVPVNTSTAGPVM